MADARRRVVLMQMEVWPAQNWALVARASARGARILLNAAPAGPIPGIALAALDWLIVNETEAVAVAAGLGLGRLEARAAAAAIAGAADITCIVTLGGEGALGVRAEAVLAGRRDGYLADRYHGGGRCLCRRLRRGHCTPAPSCRRRCTGPRSPADCPASLAARRPVCRKKPRSKRNFPRIAPPRQLEY